MRSLEVANLRNMPPTSSPYKKRSQDFESFPENWTPISISSGSSDEDDKEDEKRDDFDETQSKGRKFYDHCKHMISRRLSF